jgi:RNA polymerase sigma-70 factor (ECF subfamily)
VPGRDLSIDRELIRRLYAYVALRIGDGPDAEDVVSDTIERALRYRRSYDPNKGEPAAWLVGIARRRLASLQARPMSTVPLNPDDTVTAGDLEQEVVERLALQAVVARLDDRDRELVSLHYGADLSPLQIARLLDAKQNAVEVALHRARGRLRALLEGQPGWEERPSSRAERL